MTVGGLITDHPVRVHYVAHIILANMNKIE